MAGTMFGRTSDKFVTCRVRWVTLTISGVSVPPKLLELFGA